MIYFILFIGVCSALYLNFTFDEVKRSRVSMRRSLSKSYNRAKIHSKERNSEAMGMTSLELVNRSAALPTTACDIVGSKVSFLMVVSDVAQTSTTSLGMASVYLCFDKFKAQYRKTNDVILEVPVNVAASIKKGSSMRIEGVIDAVNHPKIIYRGETSLAMKLSDVTISGQATDDVWLRS